MTTKEYIKKYHLQEENFNLNFDKFLKDFINEFNERIERTIAERKKADLDFGFNIFQNLIKEMQTKFNSISAHTPGSLPDTIWNGFYAKGVIPARAKYFPVEHAEINVRRDKFLKEQALKESAKNA